MRLVAFRKRLLFFNFMRGDSSYLLELVKLLVGAGIDVNAVDKYGAISLKYAITICKLSTDELKNVYKYLIETGINYKQEDKFGKNCIDYAKELSWRNGFMNIVEEFEND